MMKYQEAKNHFISQWGNLSGEWGMNRTMGQIQALLLISEAPLCAEDLIEQLNVSRGNVNMSVRSLIDIGLVERVHKIGERKEFFRAEKDPYRMMIKIAQQRRQKEIEPLLKLLAEVNDVDSASSDDDKELVHMKQTLNNLAGFTKRKDKLLRRLIKSDQDWFNGIIAKILK